MDRFILGSDRAYNDLKRRAARACIRFHHTALPSGCRPLIAKVGFEIDPANGMAILYVERGITYRGKSGEVRRWIKAGGCIFPNFTALRKWIQHSLASVYVFERFCSCCHSSNDVRSVVCHQCGSHLAEATCLTETHQRVREHLRDHEIELLTGSVSARSITRALNLSSSLIRWSLERIAQVEPGLQITSSEEDLLLFREPIEVRSSSPSMVDRIRALFSTVGNEARKINELAIRRATLAHRQSALYETIERLEHLEASLLQEGKKASSLVERRRLANQISRIRREMVRYNTIVSVVNRQRCVLSTDMFQSK